MNNYYALILKKIKNDLNIRNELNVKSIYNDYDIINFLTIINKNVFNEILFELSTEYNNVEDHLFNLSETQIKENDKDVIRKFIYLINCKKNVFTIKLINNDSFEFNELLKKSFLELLMEEYEICFTI